MTESQPVYDVATALTQELWDQARAFFDGARTLNEDIRACWEAALALQGGDPDNFQMPEPFAGYGGDTTTTPSLLIVGCNPGYDADQDFPRWRDVRGPTGFRAYLEFFWRGFDGDHRAGRRGTGAPLAWSRNRDRVWPIGHYGTLEAGLGGGALSNWAWEVDALPWKDRSFKGRVKGRRKGLERVAQHRVARALDAIAPDAEGNRRVVVLGDDPAQWLGLSPKLHRHTWQPLTTLEGRGVSNVVAFITYHPNQQNGLWPKRSVQALYKYLPR